MNSGKIVARRVDGTEIEGSTRGPRGPKKFQPSVSATKPQVSEWKPSLSNPESPEFEALANTIEEDLKGMLLR